MPLLTKLAAQRPINRIDYALLTLYIHIHTHTSRARRKSIGFLCIHRRLNEFSRLMREHSRSRINRAALAKIHRSHRIAAKYNQLGRSSLAPARVRKRARCCCRYVDVVVVHPPVYPSDLSIDRNRYRV